MGLYPQPSAPESLLGGAEGGGGAGWRLLCAPTHAGGGVAGGSSVRLGRKNPVASPGPVGPFEEEPRIRRGGLRYMVWYGMVWYGMVWYGMVWYGMVWYGMVWYGMVWYGMVWYGMVWYGMAWIAIFSESPIPITHNHQEGMDSSLHGPVSLHMPLGLRKPGQTKSLPPPSGLLTLCPCGTCRR